MNNLSKIRCDRVNTCRECRQSSTHCRDGKACASVRGHLRPYGGIRPTSDGFDCALPESIDSHSFCSYACLYCFSVNLIEHREASTRTVGQTSLRFIEAVFSGRPGKQYDLLRRALKYDAKVNGYPCPIQLGAICDPLDNIERQQGWFLEFVKLAIKYNQPVRISTKGNLFLTDEYLRAVAAKPELFAVLFSIVTPDEDVLSKVDVGAPSCRDRIESMRRLNAAGVRSWLRMRPILPGISDSTRAMPDAYRVLLQMAHDAGADAVSYEVAFLPGAMTRTVRKRWETIEQICGVPLRQVYRSFGPRQACTRPSYRWTEQIMHAIHDEAHRLEMIVGISDPVWKQLGDTGCCCGFLPDDPVFGNWQRESATNQLLEAKRTGKRLTSRDIVPAWAREASLNNICALRPGPLEAYAGRHGCWSDKLEKIWRDSNKQRSPLQYFQGALIPVERLPDGDVAYVYRGLERCYPERTPYWNVNTGKGESKIKKRMKGKGESKCGSRVTR